MARSAPETRVLCATGSRIRCGRLHSRWKRIRRLVESCGGAPIAIHGARGTGSPMRIHAGILAADAASARRRRALLAGTALGASLVLSCVPGVPGIPGALLSGAAWAQTVTPVGATTVCEQNTAAAEFACGSGSVATGLGSTAVGINAIANATFTSAYGFSAQATAIDATATGADAIAAGIGSTATGAGANASGLNSTATGVR